MSSDESVNNQLLCDLYIATIKAAKGLRNDLAVADLLEMKSQSFSNMKMRGTLLPRLMDLAEKLDINVPNLVWSDGEGGGVQSGFSVIKMCDLLTGQEGCTDASNSSSCALAFRNDWLLNTLHANPANVALMKTIGDSMEPTFRAGDMVLVDMGTTVIKDEAIYALETDGMVLIKRVRWLPGGGIALVSDNPTYTQVTIDAEKRGEMVVVGRVIWWGRSA